MAKMYKLSHELHVQNIYKYYSLRRGKGVTVKLVDVSADVRRRTHLSKSIYIYM